MAGARSSGGGGLLLGLNAASAKGKAPARFHVGVHKFRASKGIW